MSQPPPAAATKEFTPAHLEALAYREAGRAVMAILIGVPLKGITIGPKCTDGFISKIDLDSKACPEVATYKFSLICVASEPAGKLYATLNRPPLPPDLTKQLRVAARNDLVNGYNALTTAFRMMGYADSTARGLYKKQYRDLAAELFDIPLIRAAVQRLAELLARRHQVSGKVAASVVREGGPLTDNGLLQTYLGISLSE